MKGSRKSVECLRKCKNQIYNRIYKFTMIEKGLMSRIFKRAKGNW